ncbi:hypothetical protein SAMN05421813_11761 [Daejeonella rubra]|uniref:Uncharacterized protein n=1 Tax=Daejeonella rubra TaxID=990371 RepID=A0A1G9URS8_9SPHI|nr:hypothetical protein [Daejeonella rubra]SDM62574.1 hypothetical protein SAMN05421813_11761 [Daejeonella rubra]
MTVITQEKNEVKIQQDLNARNKAVEKAFHQITKSAKLLLLSFEAPKYRTSIQVNHAKSGKETTLVSEFICHFFNLTLATNRVGYKMIYFAYDSEALSKFGPRLYNRVLRVVFKHSMIEASKINIEDSIRVSSEATEIQKFFLNRLANGGNDFITIEVEAKAEN